MQNNRILLTKITPPPRSSRTLLRPRVLNALEEAVEYRLTILQAGAGYGKSTALIGLAETIQPLIWYQASEEDNDPLVFLLHLNQATHRAFPNLEGLPIFLLESWDGSLGPLPSANVIDQFLNALSQGLSEQTLLVLDDMHYLTSNEIALQLDRLISLASPNIHIIVATRLPFKLPNLSRWKAQGEVLVFDQTLLAFNVKEINALFANHYGYELTFEEAENLYTATEGWPIALQLIWQSLRSGTSESVDDALARQATSLDSLFEILAGEVFEGLPDDVKSFLLASSVLRVLVPEACDALGWSKPFLGKDVRGSGFVTSSAMVSYLLNHDLFIITEGYSEGFSHENGIHLEPIENHFSRERIRYHHIFQNFLLQQAPPDQRSHWHTLAAKYFLSKQIVDEAIYHYQQANEMDMVAELLDTYGNHLLSIGRLDTLAAYLDCISPDSLHNHPALLFFLGELARLHSRFQEALGWYQQAEVIWREHGQREGVGRALRGQARVYLDTVNPARAEELLQQALRMSDGTENRQSQARLYELLAENKLNAGRVEEAERLSQQAEALLIEGPSDSQLKIRVMLRTGRLHEAQLRLEKQAKTELLEPVSTPRAHRETKLLLSLIYAFQGLPVPAYQTAVEGTDRGIDLRSPFVTAVGHMRQGHSLMLFNNDDHYSQARLQFEKAIEISQTLAVPRLRVEAYWGLCRAYGYQGDLLQASQHAEQGIQIANQAGDEWIASLIRLTLGASLVLASRFETASEWLNRANQGFQECSDPFGNCASRLWLCLGWFRQKDWTRLVQGLTELLNACRESAYDYLLSRPTLLGIPDERLLVPLLIIARDQTKEHAYAYRLLKNIGLPEISSHPGYRLRVYCLGTFQTLRGDEPIRSKSWRREKAKQLFQILLTYRSSPIDRDQILEYLWPELDPLAAQRNFKVILNTLYNVLEPKREPGSESAYIVREATTYGLRPGADLWLDVDEFCSALQRAVSSLITEPDKAMFELEKAIEIYQGEYLPEARYETWAAAERENLSVLFLQAADQLSELYIQHGKFKEAISLCSRILAIDDCWERAYRHMMLAFDQLGDQGQIARTYNRCVQTLRDELEVSPAIETETLFRQLTHQKGKRRP
jgi:LuxR family transcriptional regulator, maltose regulon positive regulatory protein